MPRVITSVALLSFMLAGCDPTLPVKIDTSAIHEMPQSSALAYPRNWQSPAGATVNALRNPHTEIPCGSMTTDTMSVRDGKSFSYRQLHLQPTVYVHNGRYKQVTISVVESAFVWCIYRQLSWDIQNAALNQRMDAEVNRIGTAFAALGVKIEP